MPNVEPSTNPREPVSETKLLDVWKRRLHAAEKKLKDKGGDITQTAGWKSLIDFYEGKQWPSGMGGKAKTFDRITANQAKSNIDAMRPQLYFQNPKVKIQIENPDIAQVPIPETQMMMGPAGPQPQPVMDPMTGQPKIKIQAGTPIANVGGQVVDAQAQVELLEAIDNYYLELMQVKKKVRLIINDALILPYGVSKLEWIVETEEIEEQDEEGEPTGKKVEALKRQYPRFSRIKPWCFLWDTELDEFDLDESNWVAEIKYLSKDDILSDKNLKVSESDLDEPSHYIDDEYLDHRMEGDNREDRARWKVYEIHDLRNSRMFVYIDGMDSFARFEDPSYYRVVDGSVYTVLGFDCTPNDSFPLSYIDQIRSKAQAYNKILSYAVNHIARFNRKYKEISGNMSPEEKEKFERGEDGAVVDVKDMFAGPEPITDAPIASDVYAIKDALKREITEDLGVTSYSRATREPGVDTAFEANLIQSGADVKVQEKRDIVREFMRSIVKKLNQILKSYADSQQAIQIAGSRGQQWQTWNASDIQGEFLEDVDIYTSMPFSDEIERKQMMEFYSLVAADPYFKPLETRKRVLRTLKMPDTLIYSDAEMQQQQQAQQQAQAGAQGQMQAAQSGQSQTLRPTEGDVRRRPDMLAGIIGPARRAAQ